MLNVVLFNPENPFNTGSVVRTCSLLGARLHLIKPLGFALPNKNLHRASMDYASDYPLILHETWEEFSATAPGQKRIWLFSDSAAKIYHQVNFRENDYLVFGSESSGLPASIINNYPGLSIPMPGVVKARTDHRDHSLNVSISVSIALGEACRQLRHYDDIQKKDS